MRVSVFRKEHFNAAHRLFNPEWNTEKNDAIFGKCNNPNYHGHNYGDINLETGYVYDLKVLSDLINKNVIDRFDHKNLNLDVDEFKNLNPTAENIVIVIYDILRGQIEGKYDLKIQLYETERNFVEYPS
jgi:6-pyruvoyltetrahydropterin/6-carboxytetrahydropterin synthase